MLNGVLLDFPLTVNNTIMLPLDGFNPSSSILLKMASYKPNFIFINSFIQQPGSLSDSAEVTFLQKLDL